VTDVEKYPIQAAKIGQDVDIIFTLLNFFFTACSVDFNGLLIFFKPYCHASVNRNSVAFLLPGFSFVGEFFGILQPMFDGLKQRWKVENTQLALILCTFAVTGTLTAYISRAITEWAGLEESNSWAWRILRWMGVLKKDRSWKLAVGGNEIGGWRLKVEGVGEQGNISSPSFGGGGGGGPVFRLAIFASGAGSNAQKIIDHFRGDPNVEVSLIVCNKPGAGVLDIAKRENIPALLIEKERFFRGDAFLPELQHAGIDAIILAGFLWKVPTVLIKAYPQKIINIHPALLPKYGGKGMYGHFVHEAVIAAKDMKSGITIHFVDDVYDHGAVIFQADVPITENDTPESLARKVQVLEHLHFPQVVAEWVQLQNRR